MSDDYLRRLEENAVMAAVTLEKERYYEFTHDLMELVRQAKHYQRIAVSLLDGVAGVDYDKRSAQFDTACREGDWY